LRRTSSASTLFASVIATRTVMICLVIA
jgi:hypothetical protein